MFEVAIFPSSSSVTFFYVPSNKQVICIASRRNGYISGRSQSASQLTSSPQFEQPGQVGDH